MMQVAVTFEQDNYRLDLALPVGLPAYLLSHAIAEKLGLHPTPGRMFSLGVQTETGLRVIPPHMTLSEAGLLHGMRVTLRTVESSELALAYVEIEGGRRIPLSNLAVIGRSDPQHNTIVEVDVSAFLPNPKLISRRHARIWREGEQYFLQDLESNNGTRLNGRQLQPRERALLCNGDVIVLGRDTVRLRFFQRAR